MPKSSFLEQALLEMVSSQPLLGQMLISRLFVHKDTLLVPQFSVEGVQGGSFVLAIVDPDAPSRANPTISQIRHMLAANFSVSSNRSSFAPRSFVLQNSTAAINEYIPPVSPPRRFDKGGARRLIICVADTPGRVRGPSLHSPALCSTCQFRFVISERLVDQRIQHLQFCFELGLGGAVSGNVLDCGG
jgi:hypothetical protein